MPPCSKSAPSLITRDSPPPPPGRSQRSRREARAAVRALERRDEALLQSRAARRAPRRDRPWLTPRRGRPGLRASSRRGFLLRRFRFRAPSRVSPASAPPPRDRRRGLLARALGAASRPALRPGSRLSCDAAAEAALALGRGGEERLAFLERERGGIAVLRNLRVLLPVGDVGAVAALQHLDAGIREIEDRALAVRLRASPRRSRCARGSVSVNGSSSLIEAYFVPYFT